MKFSFEAKIYKVGINPCVKVPFAITDKMKPLKGYIPVKGKISKHPFGQTLVPIKNAEYRLYVNGPMLKGSNTKTGDTVKFIIEEDFESRVKPVPMHPLLEKQLREHKLMAAFKQLIPSRQKEILKYLYYLKTDKARVKNIEKVIASLSEK